MTTATVRFSLNYKEAAAFLRIGLRTLEGWVASSYLPENTYKKLGGRVRFDPDALAEWAESL